MLLKMKGYFFDIMCEVNEAHRNNVIEEKGKHVLYVSVTRSIYGCVESAILWYEIFSSTLKQMGFKLNPYDRCKATNMINGK